jgi:glutamate racemase
VDVVGVIGPGGRKAVRLTAGGASQKIAVIATEATVASNAYYDAIRRSSDQAEVFQAACPLFVPLAEEGWTHEPETYSIARKYLNDIKKYRPDALVLGCTHYPILKDVIRQTVGESVTLIDSGEAAAEEVEQLLAERGFANDNVVAGSRRLCDDLNHFYVTDAAERFARVAERFLGSTPSRLEAIEIYGQDEVSATILK